MDAVLAKMNANSIVLSQSRVLEYMKESEEKSFYEFMEYYVGDDEKEIPIDWYEKYVLGLGLMGNQPHIYYNILMVILRNPKLVKESITNKLTREFNREFPNENKVAVEEETKESTYKVVKACYYVEECFKVPKNINLEDKSQVKEYWVKYNTLHINLTNGQHIEVDNCGWVDNYDYKYPDDEITIEDADDNGFDESDFENVNIEPEPKKVEEKKVETVKVHRITINGEKVGKDHPEGKYFRDCNNIVYDATTKEEIGIWNGERIVFNSKDETDSEATI